jgi:hypothetical protein
MATRLHREWRHALRDLEPQYAPRLKEELDGVAHVVFRIFTSPMKVGKPRGFDRPTIYLLLALLAKAFKTLQAIRVVAKEGLGQDATVLLRALFETCLAIEHILRRKHRLRTRIYVAYTAHRRVVMIESWQQIRGLKRNATKALLATARKQRDEIVAILPPGTAYQRHWSGYGSFEELTKKLKAAGGYGTFYRFASAIAHGADADDHVTGSPSGVGTFKLLPGPAHLDQVLAVAPAALWLATSQLNRKLGLGRDHWLAAVRPPAARPRKRGQGKGSKGNGK